MSGTFSDFVELILDAIHSDEQSAHMLIASYQQYHPPQNLVKILSKMHVLLLGFA